MMMSRLSKTSLRLFNYFKNEGMSECKTFEMKFFLREFDFLLGLNIPMHLRSGIGVLRLHSYAKETIPHLNM